MNPLTDGLPLDIDVNGKPYDIKTDFREWIRFQAISDEAAAIQDRTERSLKQLEALNLFIAPDTTMEFVQGAFPALLAFYACAINEQETEFSQKDQRARPKHIFDYKEDAFRVYAAFMQAYDINLFEVEYLHWWEFRALLDNMPEDTRLREVMGIRATDISARSKMSKEYKDRIKQLQEVYSLNPKKRHFMTVEERDAMWLNEFRQKAEAAGLEKVATVPDVQEGDKE